MSSSLAERKTRYVLKFKASALKEWDALVGPVKDHLRKKLAERLEHPRVERDKLSGQENKDRYKIKLRASGYRLVYQVYDTEVVVGISEVSDVLGLTE
jgi:mRNA interferase RelE/StbE